MELVGIAEIAELLGLSRQRVHVIIRTKSDFPKPVAELSAGKIWMKRDVDAWISRSGRKGPGKR